MADLPNSSHEPSTESARRAELTAISGLVLQLIFFSALLLVALWNQSAATFVTAFFLLGGVIIWLGILLVYHQEKLVHIEALEAEQIDRDREAIGAETLFDEGRAGVDALLVARTRLQWMQKWLLPILGVLTSIYLIAMGVYLQYWYLTDPVGSVEWPAIQNASVSLAFVGGVAFLSFLFSRYTVGMARIGPMWQLLRAGGSYLTGNALVCGLTAGMLGFAIYNKVTPEQVFAKIVPFFMCVIGAEFILNLILEIYRPRKPGEVPRPAFDSRLLGLISEPGGIARTIAEAVNYQFGFEVSKTWFYQLLQRWALVLIAAAVLILVGMTCIVIVEPGERAVVERFGDPLGLAEGELTELEPGIHLKWPWPVDRARRYPVEHIRSITLGFGPWKSARHPEYKGEPNLILWTNPVHGPGQELDYLMPVRPEVAQAGATTRPLMTTRPAEDGARTPPVNMIRIGAPVMYRVRNLRKYAYNYANPETLIESAAYGEIVKYVATQDLDSMLAVKRAQASAELKRAIQKQCDELDVGVEITFVGMENIHPPQKVAKEFEEYLNAKYEKGAAIAEAQGEANKILTEAAGSRAFAEKLGKAINEAQQLQSSGVSEEKVEHAWDRVEQLFASGEQGRGVSGLAAEIVAVARADRWSRENIARGRASSFVKELTAYRSASRLYKMRRIVEVLIQGLRGVDKFVVAHKGDMILRYDAIQRERMQLEDIDYNVPPD